MCDAAKIDAHVRQAIAAKPKLVQISTAYGVQKEGSAAIPRNRCVVIRQEKPTKKQQETWPEYKACKFTSEGIVTEGSDKGEIRRLNSRKGTATFANREIRLFSSDFEP
jgi:ParB family chromosome partitioning protein